MFRINDAAHRGCLKVGEATCDNDNVFGLAPNSKALNESAKKRINQYTQTAGIAYDLLYTELTIYNSKKAYALSMTRRCIAFWSVPASGKRSLIPKTRPTNGSSLTLKRSSGRLRQSRRDGSRLLLRKFRMIRLPLHSVPNSVRPSRRPRSSSRKAIRCCGMPKCVSERPYRLCKW